MDDFDQHACKFRIFFWSHLASPRWLPRSPTHYFVSLAVAASHCPQSSSSLPRAPPSPRVLSSRRPLCRGERGLLFDLCGGSEQRWLPGLRRKAKGFVFVKEYDKMSITNQISVCQVGGSLLLSNVSVTNQSSILISCDDLSFTCLFSSPFFPFRCFCAREI